MRCFSHKSGILRLFIFIAAAGLMFAGCGGGKGSAPVTRQIRKFPDVDIPGMMDDPAERLDYAVEHFWDRFLDTSFTGKCDSALVNGVTRQEVENGFGTYSTLLWQIDVRKAVKSVASLFTRAEAMELRDTSSNVFETITAFAYKYFYDPNSPVRNEEFYLPYVEGLTHSPAVKEEMKPAYSYDASMCSLNRIGDKAADFSFTDLAGRRHTLYGVKADYTLLFFSNPGCHSCKEITDVLVSEPFIDLLQATGRLVVVNVYIDQELDKWREYAAEYPSKWISGYDQDYIIRTDQLYSIRAIPSLYLLDSSKNVILKDAPQDKVFDLLSVISSQCQ
ncbi:MAG: DUF5106 domain-containing protein [Candidatus Cryptobacteroides sp.]